MNHLVVFRTTPAQIFVDNKLIDYLSNKYLQSIFMNSSIYSVESLLNEFMQSLPSQQAQQMKSNHFTILFQKAYQFLEWGPKAYRSKDAFDFPLDSWDHSILQALEIASQQILQGYGPITEKPIRSVSIRHLKFVFLTFHFEMEGLQLQHHEHFQHPLACLELRYIPDDHIVYYYALPDRVSSGAASLHATS